jgi:hypothetical protein
MKGLVVPNRSGRLLLIMRGDVRGIGGHAVGLGAAASGSATRSVSRGEDCGTARHCDERVVGDRQATVLEVTGRIRS